MFFVLNVLENVMTMLPNKINEQFSVQLLDNKTCPIHDKLSFRLTFYPPQFTAKFKMEQKTTVSLWIITPSSIVTGIVFL